MSFTTRWAVVAARWYWRQCFPYCTGRRKVDSNHWNREHRKCTGGDARRSGNQGADPTTRPIDRGDNAWMLTSSALVLFMTAPGLAMFYGGLVRKKNVLGVMMQCLFLMGLMTVIWALYGYSLGVRRRSGGGRRDGVQPLDRQWRPSAAQRRGRRVGATARR